MTEVPSVYLLKDHEIVRQDLRMVLEATGRARVIGESASAVEAAQRIPELRPVVSILDVRLPDGSGIQACRSTRSADPSLEALILTSYDDHEALLAARPAMITALVPSRRGARSTACRASGGFRGVAGAAAPHPPATTAPAVAVQRPAFMTGGTP